MGVAVRSAAGKNVLHGTRMVNAGLLCGTSWRMGLKCASKIRGVRMIGREGAQACRGGESTGLGRPLG